MKNIITLVALSLLSLNSIAASKGDTYTGFQYAVGAYSDTDMAEISPNAIVGRAGKYLEDDLAIEGRLWFASGDDATYIAGTNAVIEVDALFGVYALKHADIGGGSSIYGALGFSQGELTASGVGFSVSGEDSGFSFGVGANFNNINIELMQYLNKSDLTFSAVSIGVTF
jgi:outer membrane immunogenic protein